MELNARKKQGEKGCVFGILRGWATGIIVLAAGMALITTLINAGKMKWENTSYAMALLLILCGCICTAVFRRADEGNGRIIAMIQSVLFGVAITAAATCIWGIQYDVAGMSMMLITGGALAAGISNGPRKKRSVARNRKPKAQNR